SVWKKGKINSEGTFYFRNGDKYICDWKKGNITEDATYVMQNGRIFKGHLSRIEQQISEDRDLLSSMAVNMGIAWYTVALEHKHNKQYKEAEEFLRLAQNFESADPKLHNIIPRQMAILNEKTAF
ncbi:MAG: hypothetical protein AAFP19_07425, partial [Bacteroidota bacterium]